MAKDLPGLRINPLGVKKEQYRLRRWIDIYRFISIKADSLPIAALHKIQYEWALYRLIR